MGGMPERPKRERVPSPETWGNNEPQQFAVTCPTCQFAFTITEAELSGESGTTATCPQCKTLLIIALPIMDYPTEEQP